MTFIKVLVVNPLLLVPPTKVIIVTITEPLKYLGQGINWFLRALLKDLPVTLQMPFLLFIVLPIVYSHLVQLSVGPISYAEDEDGKLLPLIICKEYYMKGSMEPSDEVDNIDAQM